MYHSLFHRLTNFELFMNIGSPRLNFRIVGESEGSWAARQV